MVREADDIVKLTDDSDVDQRPMIGALLRRVGDAVDEKVHEALLHAGYDDIPISHHVVFQHLDPRGSRLGQLAERARMTKQSMQYLVDQLEEGGYVHRTDDPRDARAKLVRLTGRGRNVERAARSGIAELQREWAARLGEKEFQLFMKTLRELEFSIDTGSR